MSKRSKNKYPNLQKNLNLKRRQELIDFDYIDQLSDEEKEWLNKFMGEYMGASFPRQVVTKKDGTIYKRYSSKNLHKKEDRVEIYNQNNARNRDVYAKKTSTGGMEFFDEVTLDNLREKDIIADVNSFEDAIIEKDLYSKDLELYMIEINEYLNTIKNIKERQKEIEYLISQGCHWLKKEST
jgi:hypothetical protein